MRRRLFGRAPQLQRVRIHLRKADPSIEGFLVSRYPIDGCYRLIRAVHVEAEDRSIALEGEVDVPVDGVLFIQRLGTE